MAKSEQMYKELEDAAQPLVEFLYKYYNPMCKVIVNIGHVEVVEREMGLPVKLKH